MPRLRLGPFSPLRLWLRSFGGVFELGIRRGKRVFKPPGWMYSRLLEMADATVRCSFWRSLIVGFVGSAVLHRLGFGVCFSPIVTTSISSSVTKIDKLVVWKLPF